MGVNSTHVAPQLNKNEFLQLQLTIDSIIYDNVPTSPAAVIRIRQLTRKASAVLLSRIATKTHSGITQAVYTHICCLTMLADQVHYSKRSGLPAAKLKTLDAISNFLLDTIDDLTDSYYHVDDNTLFIPAAHIETKRQELQAAQESLETTLLQQDLPSTLIQALLIPYRQLLQKKRPTVMWQQVSYLCELATAIRYVGEEEPLTQELLLSLLMEYNFNSDCLVTVYIDNVAEMLATLPGNQEKIDLLEYLYLRASCQFLEEVQGLNTGKTSVRKRIQSYILYNLQIYQQLQLTEQKVSFTRFTE